MDRWLIASLRAGKFSLNKGFQYDLLFRRLWKVALHKVRRTWAAPVKWGQAPLESTGQADELGREMLIYTHNFGLKYIFILERAPLTGITLIRGEKQWVVGIFG